ncbi:MAG: PstS family phosphate ABC transporter substrate-binding protein [Actinobacteria bacterium]|nr:PstS family phosphate ABC transporter substrate-binding protein [Actinomycetota bacterium]
MKVKWLKFLVIAVVFILTVTLSIGCKTAVTTETTAAAAVAETTATQETDTSKASDETNPASSKFNDQELVVSGSTTLLEVANAWAEDFMAKFGGSITVNGGGSGVGITSLIDGTTDLANASRPMKDSEKQGAASKGIDLKEYIVLWDGIAVIVSKNVNVNEFTFDQLSKIYKGEITNWKDVGGADAEIIAAARDSSSGTYEYFLESIVRLGNKESQDEYSDKCLFLQTNADIVAQIGGNENIIGYVGLGYLKAAGDTVNAVKIKKDSSSSAVSPSVETVKDRSYPISRELYVYADGNKMTELAQAYLDFILSADGQQIGIDVGFVPVK